MTYRGHVSKGVVVLDDVVVLPEGLNVRVEPMEAVQGEPLAEGIPTLYDRLQPFVGKAEGLPPDASVNHDYYLYGATKQE
jgi:hypothetical protein